MASLVVTNTFVSGTTILSAAMNTNFSDIVTYINNRNSGSSTWDAISVLSSSTVPFIADNSSGTSNIAQFKDNGVVVFSIADGGNVTSTGVHLGPAGSAAAPTYSFSGDTNTGMYESAADTLRLVAAATVRMEFNATQTLFVGGTSAATPGFALNESNTVGFYRVAGQDIMGVSAPLGASAGTAAAPSYAFSGDINSGLYSSSADVVACTAGGTASYTWNGSGNFLPLTTNLATTATAGFFFIASCAGTPTGVGISASNEVALVWDRTNNRLYAWKPTGGWISVLFA